MTEKDIQEKSPDPLVEKKFPIDLTGLPDDFIRDVLGHAASIIYTERHRKPNPILEGEPNEKAE